MNKPIDKAPVPDLSPESLLELEPEVRFLNLNDLPELMSLEREKWNDEQAATLADLEHRILAYPTLSVGAFCPCTGALLASLFMRPVAADFWRHAATWAECVAQPVPVRSASLFGISLSSRQQSGVSALLRFFWPHALKGGWRHIYLGSPVPGLREWRLANPDADVTEYVYARRGDLPVDPQLRYYTGRGFKDIVGVKPDYFPHERSLDHGVILRGTVPLSVLVPVWKTLPLASTRRVTRQLASLL